MRFEFIADEHVKVKTFLKKHQVSKGLLAKIKFSGGQILVNGVEQNAIYLLDIGDKVTIDIPSEEGYEALEAIDRDLEILYEDDHFLVINKPAGVASIPSSLHSNTIANFVKGYYVRNQYENQLVHIVTRLDKDTSGIMLFAKHGYAHARLDKQLQAKTIQKRYFALVKGKGKLESKGDIIAPIARDEDSIITRKVAKGGKYAHTSYQVVQSFGDIHLVDIQLHTGRTHQIRVHFSHIGFPLLGDDLYGGSLEDGILRQALHCHSLAFYHPFLEEELRIESSLPDDFSRVLKQLSNIYFFSKEKLMEVFESLKTNLVGKNARIVLPEGEEPRILQAAKRIVKETDVTPVLLGNPDKIRIYLEIEGVLEGYEVIDPHSYAGFDEMVASLVERRKGKMTEEEARQILQDDVNYFGVMLVHLGIVDGMVSGAIHSTAATVRPALQIIKTRPNVKRTSGAFLMVRGSERYLFGDCAININPDAEGLAEIAINSAITAKMFGIDPKIAMLSYSTKGSGFGESVDKVVEATKIAHELRPDLEIDGELQFDAAFVPETAALKAPGSKVAGQANVFIFPGIEAGNIGYKMAERLGGFAAVGPVLQGLNKPVNDLSRGCNADDVYKLTLITAAQAVEQ